MPSVRSVDSAGRGRPLQLGCALAGTFLMLTLCGCGLSETAASAAAGGASEVQQARAAQATEERVKQQLDQANRAAAEQRAAAEAANQ